MIIPSLPKLFYRSVHSETIFHLKSGRILTTDETRYCTVLCVKVLQDLLGEGIIYVYQKCYFKAATLPNVKLRLKPYS